MNEEYVSYSPEDDYSDAESSGEDVQEHDDCKTPDQTRLYLKKKLREIENQIGETESAIVRQQREADGLKNEQESLNAEYDAIDQVLKDFDDKEEDINCELEKIENYIKRGGKQFHDALRKGVRRAIRGICETVDGEIADLQDHITHLDWKENVSPEDGSDNATVLRASNFLYNCKLIQTARQNEYDNIKNTLSMLQTSLNALNDTMTQIDAEVEGGDVRKAYVHFLDLEKQTVVVREQFESFKDGPPSEAICNAWTELDEINKLVRQAEQNLNARQADLATSQTLLTARQESRIDDIVDQIKAGDPVISL